MVQTMKKKTFTIESEIFSCYAECHNFEAGELGNSTITRDFYEFIHTISGEIFADTEDSDEIYYEVAHKQYDSS